MFFIPKLRQGVSVIGIIAAIGIPWLVHHRHELLGKKDETPPAAVSAPVAAAPAAPDRVAPHYPPRGYND